MRDGVEQGLAGHRRQDVRQGAHLGRWSWDKSVVVWRIYEAVNLPACARLARPS